MKSKLFTIFTIFTILYAILAFAPKIFAQDALPWPRQHIHKLRATKKLIDIFGKDGTGWVSDIKFSPDGSLLVVASSIGMRLYDVQTGEKLDLFPEHTDWANSVSFSLDGKMIASANSGGTIYL